MPLPRRRNCCPVCVPAGTVTFMRLPGGVRRGHLIGGCFEVLDWLRGTDFWPAADAWQDAFLFLETSEDAPSPEVVKYGLRTYAALGILPRLSGILFGRPGGQIPLERHQEYDQALLQVVAEETCLVDLPIIAGMDFGHTDPMFVLPYGIQAEIDCDAQQFAIVDSAVTEWLLLVSSNLLTFLVP